ncbi:MAG: helix-turn-helix domain-containing protein [Clostridium sp.]|nr:helix-turn-helix domain-containing protein [Clostridium sp.]MCM1444094.1 helix-turn-helix domain-containing protein [Candidatus Amulumruptor caecigallinarius]
MNIGEKISELRKKFNLTQEKLAEKVGVSRQTLANWESGVTYPDLNQAKLLSKYLKISLDELANNNLEILCSNNIKDDVFNNLIGKTCYLTISEDFFDIYLNGDKPVKVMDINRDFIKIEYQKKKEKCIKLIDADMITSIKVVEED